MILTIIAISVAIASSTDAPQGTLSLNVALSRNGMSIARQSGKRCMFAGTVFAPAGQLPALPIDNEFSRGFKPLGKLKSREKLRFTLYSTVDGWFYMSTGFKTKAGRVPEITHGVLLNSLIFEPCGIPPFGPSEWTGVFEGGRMLRRATLAVLNEWILWTDSRDFSFYSVYLAALEKCGHRRNCPELIEALSAWSREAREKDSGNAFP